MSLEIHNAGSQTVIHCMLKAFKELISTWVVKKKKLQMKQIIFGFGMGHVHANAYIVMIYQWSFQTFE